MTTAKPQSRGGIRGLSGALLLLGEVRYHQCRYGERDQPRPGDCGAICLLKEAIANKDARFVLDPVPAQALDFLVKAFVANSEREGAIRYFVEQLGLDGAKPRIARLAQGFFLAGGAALDDAIKTWRWLLEHFPQDRKAAGWKEMIAQSFERQ